MMLLLVVDIILNKLAFPILMAALISGCGGDSGSIKKLEFNVANGTAVAMGTPSAALSNSPSPAPMAMTTQHSDSASYTITTNDELEPISNGRVLQMRVFGDEVFVMLVNPNTGVIEYYATSAMTHTFN